MEEKDQTPEVYTGVVISLGDMLYEERLTVNDGTAETINVMIYELGAVAQNLMFAKNRPGATDAVRNALYANALTEISDLVAQAAILQAKILGGSTMRYRPSWDAVVAMGRARQVDRMQALRNGTTRNPSLSFGG